ncbi:ImmA/IrrE family metallo-endopeptidase [Apilactobacillus micheneri]|uniref:ImmA/IrrE family metallo-endopeptidase n=1 Tax=Apilactobacillus micheneri TaxID=1899430 RepID=UPI00112640D9|nr:ImmA/IrrE family metallo-endopeptidase [Apilactobacillus micheneri]TPR41242.1 ImmA/IrrE family metallo-endopeptidase [Apilactobacillus micheneri]
MFDDILKDLLNYAFDNGIGVETVHASINTPCLVFNKKRLIILNLNWHNKNELPFQIAHEISHIINNDDLNLYRSDSCNYTLSFEKNANVMALNILLPIYFKHCNYSINNISPLMKQLSIPNSLQKETKNIAIKYV